MLALRSAPVAIRLALAALTLLLAVYAAELVIGFLPGAVADPYMKYVSDADLPGRRGALRRARPPGPGRAWRVAADGPRRAGVGPRAALLHALPVGPGDDPGPVAGRRRLSDGLPARLRGAACCSTARASAAAAQRCGSTAPSARSRSARSAPPSCSTRCWRRPAGRRLAHRHQPQLSGRGRGDARPRRRGAGDDRLAPGGRVGLDRRRARDVRRRGQPLLLRHRASAATRRA